MAERCRFDGDGAVGAPRVWALVLSQAEPVAHAAPGAPERQRQRARQCARDALRAQLAALLGCAAADIVLTDTRGQPVRAAPRAGSAMSAPVAQRLQRMGLSISHEEGVSLIACRDGGAVGVDVVRVPADTARAGLQATAALYLGLNNVLSLVDIAPSAIFNIAFSICWARHEACLKCAGLALQEWSPALAARLAPLRTADLVLPAGADACRAAVAW